MCDWVAVVDVSAENVQSHCWGVCVCLGGLVEGQEVSLRSLRHFRSSVQWSCWWQLVQHLHLQESQCDQ